MSNSIVWSVWSLLLFKYFSISLLFLLSYFWFRFSLVNFLCHNLGLAYLQQNLKLILDKLSEIRLDKCCQKDQTLFAKYKKTWLRNLYGKVWILFAFQWRLLWWSGFQKQSCNLRPGKHFLYFVFCIFAPNVLLDNCQNRTILAKQVIFVFIFKDLIANKTLSQCWRLNLSNF